MIRFYTFIVILLCLALTAKADTIDLEFGTIYSLSNDTYDDVIGHGGSLKVPQRKVAIIYGNVSGSFIKTGKGTLVFGADNSTTLQLGDVITLQNGTLKNWSEMRLGNATIQFDGGTLAQMADLFLTNPIDVTENGGTILICSGKSIQLINKITGTGTLTKQSETGGYSSFLYISEADLSDFHGTLSTQGDTWIATGGRKDTQNVAFELQNSTLSGLYYNEKNTSSLADPICIGDLSGVGFIQSHKNAYFTPLYFEVGALNKDSSFSGAFVAHEANPLDINVTKVGTGTWTLESDNQNPDVNYDNQANLTVEFGKLVLARNSGQSSAHDLTIKSNATLQFAQSEQTISGDLFIEDNSTIEIPFELWSNLVSDSTPIFSAEGTIDISNDAKIDFLIDELAITSEFSTLVDLGNLIENYTIPSVFLQDSIDEFNLISSCDDLFLHPFGDNVYLVNTIAPIGPQGGNVPEPSTFVCMFIALIQIWLWRSKIGFFKRFRI